MMWRTRAMSIVISMQAVSRCLAATAAEAGAGRQGSATARTEACAARCRRHRSSATAAELGTTCQCRLTLGALLGCRDGLVLDVEATGLIRGTSLLGQLLDGRVRLDAGGMLTHVGRTLLAQA